MWQLMHVLKSGLSFRSLEMQGTQGSVVKRKKQESGPKSQSIASYFQMNT